MKLRWRRRVTGTHEAAGSVGTYRVTGVGAGRWRATLHPHGGTPRALGDHASAPQPESFCQAHEDQIVRSARELTVR